MENLKANIKSAKVKNAGDISNILFQMVEDGEINSFKINKIKKGANSIDITAEVPLSKNIDFNELYSHWNESTVNKLGEKYVGLKIFQKMLQMVKESMNSSEKESMFSLECKINRYTLVKYGKIYEEEFFDTILASAEPSSMKNMFLKENKWGEIKIAREKYPQIKYIVLFVKDPISAVTHRGTVSYIQYNPKSGKSTIFLKGEPEKIRPIKYDAKWLHNNAHGIAYTSNMRVNNAETLADLYPSLDYRKK